MTTPYPTPQRELWRQFQELRGMADGGYLYVAEFSTGIIKVGKAKIPAIRLARHARHAQIHNVVIRRSWTSPGHPGHSGTERNLIDFCKRRGDQVVGRGEYFRGVTFETAQKYAHLLVQLALHEQAYAESGKTLDLIKSSYQTMLAGCGGDETANAVEAWEAGLAQ